MSPAERTGPASTLLRFWLPSRGDYRGLRTTLVAAAVLYPLATLLWPLLTWLRGEPLLLSALAGQPGPTLDLPLRQGATVRYDGHAEWSIPDATVEQWSASLVPGLFTSAVVLLGCVLLWRLVDRLQAGDPFGGRSVLLVRALALLVSAGPCSDPSAWR